MHLRVFLFARRARALRGCAATGAAPAAPPVATAPSASAGMNAVASPLSFETGRPNRRTVDIAGIAPELLARVERETTELLSALIASIRATRPATKARWRPFSTTTFAATG